MSLSQGEMVGRSVTVSGVVSDPTITEGTYTLNGVSSVMTVSEGTFSFTITLADGVNKLVVTVTKGSKTAQATVQLVPEEEEQPH
jgi:hypothetical protein